MTVAWRPGGFHDLQSLPLRHPHEALALHGEHWATFLVDGQPAAIWGLLQRYPHVADLAGLVTDRVRGRHALSFIKWSRQMLSDKAYELRLRRVTAYVDAEKEEYRRFAECSGFVPESVMLEAGPTGGDLIIYVRHYPWAASSAASSVEDGRRGSRQPRRPHLHLITSPSGATTAAG